MIDPVSKNLVLCSCLMDPETGRDMFFGLQDLCHALVMHGLEFGIVLEASVTVCVF